MHIPVHLNHEVKVNDVHNFDVILVCNGSIPNKPNGDAYIAHDILGDKVDVHGNILVVGGGMVGVEAVNIFVKSTRMHMLQFWK